MWKEIKIGKVVANYLIRSANISGVFPNQGGSWVLVTFIRMFQGIVDVGQLVTSSYLDNYVPTDYLCHQEF